MASRKPWLVVLVLRGGVVALGDVLGEVLRRLRHGRAQVRVALDEARCGVGREPEQVGDDQHLPVAVRASASASSPSPCSPRPCTRKPPKALKDCGVSPRWPMTGTPASVMRRTASADRLPPSSLTALAPTLTSRAALRIASFAEAW